MEETLEKEIPPSEVKDSNEGGIRLRLRDRDLLKKRKAEAEEKATNQWVYGAQSLKRVKKKTSGTPGRKGRPRKEPPVVIPEDLGLAQETDPSPVTLPITEPVLPTIAETLPLLPAEPQPEPAPVETISEKPLEEFLIEDLGPDEEEDMPQKSIIIDTGDDEQPCADLNSQVSMAVYPPASAPSQPESLSENLII
ncbi:hemogen isoform X1 [Sinocyclocheilus rhinocerous]|uniref:hemogen isoform X1 n=1 Tax=Sinocyclocheilus rhinocerous TaxID=307959 RepID=UPI0007BA251B|nr:PREDICTED: hemogen isoform X1 [Sinocyclocheilus rhinocerous]XP_016376022.1 PREDICTED: hemogen isoform X1 [Sinocyclocheilus rhinocerous]